MILASHGLRKILEKMKQNAEFIAIHAGGNENIKVLNKALSSLNSEEKYKLYDVKKNKYYDAKAKCNLVDVFMRLIKNHEIT